MNDSVSNHENSPGSLRVLILEDNPRDAELTTSLLKRAGYELQVEVTDLLESYKERLRTGGLDVIVAEFNLRGWTALDALEIVKQSGRDIPFIVMTGSLGDEAAVELIKKGASDYVLKDRQARLPSAISQALEEKRLRLERQEAEAKLRVQSAALEAAANGIVITNRDGNILWANPAFTFLTGYSAEEAIGKNPRILKSGQHHSAFYKELWDTVLAGKVWHGELANRRKDGSLYQEELTITPVLDSRGAVTNFIAVKQDVSERRRAEESMRESEARFRLLFASNPLPMWVYDLLTLRFVEVNDAAVAYYGYSRDEFLRMKVTEIRPSEDIPLLLEDLVKSRQTLERSGPWRHRLKDGRIISVQITSHTMEWNGHRAALVVAEDISERLQAEAALVEERYLLRTLMDNLPDQIYFKDIESRFTRSNAAQTKNFGLRDPAQAVGKSDFDFFTADHAKTAYDDEQEIIRTGKPIVDKEEKETWADGRITWVSTTKMPLVDAEGNIIGTFGVSRDVTERKQSELELQRLNRALRTISRCNEILVRAQSETELTESVCKTLVELGGYRMAWVGNAEQDERKTVRPVAQAGHDAGYLDLLQVTWGDDPHGQGPTGRAIRLGQPVVNRNTQTNPAMARWRQEALKRGYGSSIALPLRAGSHVLGALTLYALESEVFDDAEVRLLSELADDLGFGIDALRARAERRRGEEELLFKSALLAAQSETTIDGILAVNPSGQVLLANRRFAEMWHLPAELAQTHDDRRLLGYVLAELKDPDAFLERINYLNAHETEKSREEIELLDGRVFDRYSSPLQAANGKHYGRIWYFREITEHKKAEAALRESEERFRRIAETIAEVFWTADPLISRMLYISPGYEQVWGRSVDSLYENPRSFAEAVHSDDRARVLSVLESQRDGKPFEQEYRIVRPDGQIRWIWDRGFPVRDKAGQLNCYVGVARDVTTRKQTEDALRDSETKYRTIFESAADAILLSDGRVFVDCSERALELFRCTRDQMIGQSPVSVSPAFQPDGSDSAQIATQTIVRAMAGEAMSFEWQFRRQDATLFNSIVRLTRLEIGGEPYLLAVISDITERKTLEAQLQQAAKIEAVGRLAGGVAHDFNNLLTVINGYSELLLETLASDHKMTAYLQEIKNAGERAASLTRQLLAFSRRQVLAPQVLDLNAVVSNLEKMLKRLIGEDITLRTALAKPLGRVKADPGQIEQVIMNLVVNARDAMPTGGELTIETGNVELDETYARSHITVKPGPHVMLAVGDTGVGMTVETQARIFEPFFTTKGEGKGTGLGLATVYGIVKQSGGSIWMYSELGHGTVFKVYFPDINEGPAAVPAKPEDYAATGTETILVVEDEAGVRSMVRLALESAGYKILETDDPQRAFDLCANYDVPIHLLLTDVVMPKMSGPSVAKQVTTLRPDIKVLFMSGYTDDSIIHHGVLSEGMPFIQKPLAPTALRKKIREVLDRK